jgi:nicotinate-nucleotide adenylyltransferase
VGGRGLSGERWGVLGGTFDPIHYAHLAIAEQVRETLELSAVLFLPARQPVHKPVAAVSEAEHRLRMVELAIAGNPHFRLSTVEHERSTPSFSVETMAQLTAERPGDRFFFIVSAEAVQGLPAWREPRRLLELCELAVVPRSGYALPSRQWLDEHFPGQHDRFIFIETTHLGHSASDIRTRVATGRSIRYLVPSDIEAYIKENKLYVAND